MASPLRLRERLSSFFGPNLDDMRIAKEDLRVMEAEFQPLEISEAEVSPPPIPEELSSQKFPQKKLVAGIMEFLPSILETPSPNEEWLFVALTLLESVEDTEAKFFFPRESTEEATEAILLWATSYQETNYMLPPLMATVHWGVVPQ